MNTQLRNVLYLLPAVLLVYLAIVIGLKLDTKAGCLKSGYPVSAVTYDLKRYCAKEFEGKDRVTLFKYRDFAVWE